MLAQTLGLPTICLDQQGIQLQLAVVAGLLVARSCFISSLTDLKLLIRFALTPISVLRH